MTTARRAGAVTARHGLLLVRADSAFYAYDIVAACRRAGARFSVTARMTPTVTRAIAGIDEAAWVPIRYRNAIFGDDEQRWVSDAEVAEIEFTAFTGRRKAEHVTARLIVRRVRRLNPRSVPAGQAEMFARTILGHPARRHLPAALLAHHASQTRVLRDIAHQLGTITDAILARGTDVQDLSPP